MKIASFIRTALSMTVFMLSMTTANAAPAYGFIRLTIYGYFVNALPTPTQINCTGQLYVTPPSGSSITDSVQSTVARSAVVTVPANTQSFTCQVTVPYYFNSVVTGSGLAVGFTMQNFQSDAVHITDFHQPISPIPSNYVTTNFSAIAML